jgi:hypothetical protein
MLQRFGAGSPFCKVLFHVNPVFALVTSYLLVLFQKVDKGISGFNKEGLPRIAVFICIDLGHIVVHGHRVCLVHVEGGIAFGQ